jgi:hypothetical protein
MNKVQAKKMLRLAQFLRTVPRKEFDMTWWIGKVGDAYPPEKVSIGCGTSACAYGWGSAIFRNLRFEEDGSPNIPTTEFFGIDGDQSYYLFGSHFNRTPKQQAKVMEKFVKDNAHT